MDPVTILAALGGAGRTEQLVAGGCSPHAIRAALAAGSVRRVRRGVLALPSAPPDAVVAVTLGVGLTCVSAFERLGLPLPQAPGRLHLAVPYNFTPGARAVPPSRFHYQGVRPPPGSVASASEALDCAGDCLDETWHLIAVDAALHRGLVTLGDVMDFRRSSRARAEFLVRHADGRSESPGETIARLALVQAGLRVCPQMYVDGAGHVDLVVENRVIVQVDGYGPHSGRRVFRRDREKSRAVIRAGRPQLTYAASELLGRARVNIVHDVREALTSWEQKELPPLSPSVPLIVRAPKEASRPAPS